jgi:beta-galactosidase
MMDAVRKLDDSRMVICAVDAPGDSTVYDYLDAIGINYNLHKYDELHEKYPDKMIFASECCATGTTRDWYYDDAPNKGYINAFDKDTNHWFMGRENTWKFFGERDWIVGAYQWTAFEHRGECVWPRLSSQSGAIDLYLQKKDAFYQNQSLFIEDRPILHLLPHWNFEGREGEAIQVGAYTNCDEVELFLNGVSQGRKAVERFASARWMVAYEPGELVVVAYKDGKAVLEDKRITTGKAQALVLKQENDNVEANGQDIVLLSCYCVDENGLEVPTATPYVSFTTNSLGTVVGTGSDICDHNSVTDTDRRMRAGKISVAVQVGTEKGDLKVYAEADGLQSAMLLIEL